MTNGSGTEIWRTRYAHPCAWDQQFPPLAMTELFARATAEKGDAPLVDFFGRLYSYKTLMAEARCFAAGLQAMGVAKGDRVGLYLPNVPVYIPAYFGAMMAGATVVNFSPLYTAHELEAQVEDSGTKIIVTLDVPALQPTALEVLRSSSLEKLIIARLEHMLPFVQSIGIRLFRRSDIMPIPQQADVVEWRHALVDKTPEPVAIDPLTDLALLQYTGGTTGTPKGAMLTHQNLSANARQVVAIDPHRGERDMIVGVLPFFHVFANACVLNRTIHDGGCIAMLPRFQAGQALKTLARAQATAMPGVPTMYQALLDHPDLKKTDFSSLRVCVSGGAPLPAPLKKQFEEATGARLIEGYGLTETSGVATANPYEDVERPGTIGHPLPGTRLALLDKEDPTRWAPPGEPGELAVLGPQVMLGYWNRPEAAASAFADIGGERWLRTGDIAVIEPDGFTRIVDRSKDMIAVGGFKVFPSQLEAVILQNPAIKEALVIGVADSYRGEVPRAFVTLQDEAEEGADALKSWVNDRLGKHERVDAVVIRGSLPKTMVGKLDRKALREEVAAEG
ncbi:AMP-binding protein [Novosphingobium sp. JCM 18896]|uniref:AMP-binding protein n=1 Tax=Novosphingobium sp. JCM 18896 TaxID=2989731 RepID=UPI0022233DCC|nr:AMP-binding protein [Novosphingobium sp. JCM 18896]MCW1429307.1 AMP-binding protein [Novosphingobium sp. JCM 18896]